MFGLAQMALDLACSRTHFYSGGRCYTYKLQDLPKREAMQPFFPVSNEYYRIIDRISAGVRP